MTQLEQRLRESELQMHSALMGRGAPYTDMCLLRLQVSTHACTAFSLHCIKTSLWAVPLLPSVYVCVIGSPEGKHFFASPVRRMQRLLYQGEARSRPEIGCSGSRDATSERGLEREQWKTCRRAKETRRKGEHIQASSCDLLNHIWAASHWNYVWIFILCCCCILQRSEVETSISTAWKRSVRRSRSRTEKNSSGLRRSSDIWLTFPLWKTTRPSTKRYCTLWWSANKTKLFPLVSQQLLIMLNLRFFSYGVLPDAIIASTGTHISHICSCCILYLKVAPFLPCWLKDPKLTLPLDTMSKTLFLGKYIYIFFFLKCTLE